jgi:Na+-transporting methylmalonyl-CoA/oxaloacetate decarboxylase gamma subunit
METVKTVGVGITVAGVACVFVVYALVIAILFAIGIGK